MHDFRWPALITLGVLVLLFSLAWNVGKARAKYKINAPATTGDPAFECVWYAAAYQQEASKRGPPFAVSTLVFCMLALGAAWGVVKGFLQ
ncbi:MAG: hypothetical protein OEP48_07505 [Betaproteobacteria bacterium]|nr:hypothetical protein [Betaproteobacteria bacterium]MDH3435382.1 hypothetical protein [Betaproteobacteria bacterium]